MGRTDASNDAIYANEWNYNSLIGVYQLDHKLEISDDVTYVENYLRNKIVDIKLAKIPKWKLADYEHKLNKIRNYNIIHSNSYTQTFSYVWDNTTYHISQILINF